LLALLVGYQFTCFTSERLAFDVVGRRNVAETDSRERYDREVDAHCARRRRVSTCTVVLVEQVNCVPDRREQCDRRVDAPCVFCHSRRRRYICPFVSK
jgi:hypothetical protein